MRLRQLFFLLFILATTPAIALAEEQVNVAMPVADRVADEVFVTISGMRRAFGSDGTIDVPYGGTGATTLTGIIKGNGTDAMTAAAITDYPLGLQRRIFALSTEQAIAGDAAAADFVFAGTSLDTSYISTAGAFAANVLGAQSEYEVLVHGRFTSDGSESEGQRLRFYVDTGSPDLILDTGALDLSTAQTGSAWIFRATVRQDTTGASGVYFYEAEFLYDLTGGTEAQIYKAGTGTRSTTVAQPALTINHAWSNGDATPDVLNLDNVSILFSDI